MGYDGDVDKIRPDLPKLLNECAGVRSDSEAWLMGLAADEIERLRAVLKDIANHDLEVGASTAARWALQDTQRREA